MYFLLACMYLAQPAFLWVTSECCEFTISEPTSTTMQVNIEVGILLALAVQHWYSEVVAYQFTIVTFNVVPCHSELKCMRLTCFLTCLKFRYNENEIQTKVEELRQILSEKEGITSKDKKLPAKYVDFSWHFTLIVNLFVILLLFFSGTH